MGQPGRDGGRGTQSAARLVATLVRSAMVAGAVVYLRASELVSEQATVSLLWGILAGSAVSSVANAAQNYLGKR
jgi:hypothetical protein